MHTNEELIQKFYSAFQNLDAANMAACYAHDVQFSDPVFPCLQGQEASDMWRMLCVRAQDFSLQFDGIVADDKSGRAHWIATYTFSPTGPRVVNHIQASFEFKDGKILSHQDRFDLWKWSRQALGIKGLLLGWSPLLKHAIQKQAGRGLALFREKSA